MKAVTATLSGLAAAVLGWGALQAASAERRDEDVVITAVTDDPCCGSGVIAFAVAVSGRVDGAARSYFIPFMAPGQARPRIGESCEIAWRWWQSKQWHWVVVGGPPLWQGREVTGFRCRRFDPEDLRRPISASLSHLVIVDKIAIASGRRQE